jgi:hypothetical protein
MTKVKMFEQVQFRRRTKMAAKMPKVAGATGLEPATYGFGDRRSTN